MSYQASRWRIVWANGDVEELPHCVLRSSVDGKLLFMENRTSYSIEIIRTLNVELIRSWEPIR